ncbi:hypothetical protein M9H77_02045 [Catharanthus roseus]|uniref:Uncharacterized protein n=1 Tax=Catharanthus roseus TaxID=4058 RepID=A0ACC0C7S1_CATRO|nr:hypothetical protein M9H77_02045 [Catharanthus roseus]
MYSTSGLIWSGDRETCYNDLQCRRFGRNIFQCYSTAPRRLVEIIDRTELGGVFRYGYIGLDHALITSLAAVHGGFGRCTTDWEGLSVCSDLGVVTYPKQYWIDLIERLLGVRLSLGDFSEYEVKKEPLEAWILRAFTGSETDNDLILRASGFILLIIGEHMLPDFSEKFCSRAAVHGGFGRCTKDWEGLSVCSDLGVVTYTYIAASANDGDLSRPSCSAWRNMVHNI